MGLVRANYQGIRGIKERPSRLLPPLHPTINLFAGNNLGHKPSAGAAGGPQEGDTQGIAEELAVLAGAGSRGWVRLDLNASST